MDSVSAHSKAMSANSDAVNAIAHTMGIKTASAIACFREKANKRTFDGSATGGGTEVGGN